MTINKAIIKLKAFIRLIITSIFVTGICLGLIFGLAGFIYGIHFIIVNDPIIMFFPFILWIIAISVIYLIKWAWKEDKDTINVEIKEKKCN